MRRGWKRLRIWYAAQNIQRKLLLLFSGVFLPLLLLFGAVMFISLVNNSRTQLLYSARQSHQQAMAFLSNKVDLSLYVSDVIYYDLSVHRLVLSSTSAPTDLGNEYRDFYTVWSNLKKLSIGRNPQYLSVFGKREHLRNTGTQF